MRGGAGCAVRPGRGAALPERSRGHGAPPAPGGAASAANPAREHIPGIHPCDPARESPGTPSPQSSSTLKSALKDVSARSWPAAVARSSCPRILPGHSQLPAPFPAPLDAAPGAANRQHVLETPSELQLGVRDSPGSAIYPGHSTLK